MLKQTSVAEIKRGAFPRDRSHLVITMRYYPRFLRKELRDEFIPELAPRKELLTDFNAAQKRLGDHNGSFAAVTYEERFQLTPDGVAHLKRLADLSATKDVYLACICAVGERCHREILMLIAHDMFGCAIGDVYHEYPIIMKRLPEFAALT